MSDDGAEQLTKHLQAYVDEYLFDVNGRGEWHVYGSRQPAQVYDVDQDVVPDHASAIFVRRSDGKRFVIFGDVHVAVEQP